MAPAGLDIRSADFDDRRVVTLLETHQATAFAETASGSAYALDAAALQAPDIALWTAWIDDDLVGCAALKRLSHDHGEVKSMHTVQGRRGTGIGGCLLRFVIAVARDRDMVRLSLQTGTWPFFKSAIALYRAHGFVECPPFAAYVADPNSVYLALDIQPGRSIAPEQE